MSKYEVRFIKNETDPDEAHVVVEVVAWNHDEAMRKAREAQEDDVFLAGYGFWSVAVTRY